MKIFTGTQIRELDTYTIEHEPIRPIDLMERAAKAVTRVVTERWDTRFSIVVFAGPGNNGGDALAVARMLGEQGYTVAAYLFNIHNQLSEECSINKKRLSDGRRVKDFTEVTLDFDPPKLNADTLVIDGLFGSGLNKPMTGGFSSLAKYINQSACQVVSIDLPSGLMTEDNTYNVYANIVKANLTLTFGFPKLAMLLADNQPYLGDVRVLDIRLSQEYISRTDSQFAIVEEQDIRRQLRQRGEFSHKGQMGHALIVAGSYGMTGAAILATKACLRAGAGKVTVRTPRRNYSVMQLAVPEAVLQMDHEDTHFSEPIDTKPFDAIGLGPGIGTQEHTAIALISQIRRAQCHIVLDADALNILANHRAWMQQLPKGIIMTPHPAEFDRLSGNTSNGCYDRLAKARDMAEQLDAYILLKGHFSALCLPDGHVLINPTGNAGMATAGCGDVLAGIITGLLARGYDQREACTIGMYLHGLAGDIAVRDIGQESLIASDLINYLPKAFSQINN